MRSAPPLRVLLPVDRSWSVFSTAVCLLTAGVMTGWWGSHFPFRTVTSALVCSMVWAGGLLLSLWSWRRGRPNACMLRWDGERWWHRRCNDGKADQDETAGQLAVMIDLNHWLLLRFEAQAPRGLGMPAAVHWLAVSQSALRAHWHPLRCAVYSPRPAATRLHDR